MKKLSRAATITAVLLGGLGAAFQVGKTVGFQTGSEWALVQADIVAREAGLFMPVYMEGDNFRVVLRQPHGLYKKAWELADRHDETRKTTRTSKAACVAENVPETKSDI
jgi:hypothetical protein